MFQASNKLVSAINTLIINQLDYFLKGANFSVLIFTGQHDKFAWPCAELSPQEKHILCADADVRDY